MPRKAAAPAIQERPIPIPTRRRHALSSPDLVSWVLVGVLAATDVAFGLHWASTASAHSVDHLPIAALVVLLVAGNLAETPISIRRHTVWISVYTCVVVLAIVFDRRWEILPAVAAGSLGFGVIKRLPPLKVMFNVTNAALSTAGAAAAFNAVASPAQAPTLSGWVAITAAVFVVDLGSGAGLLLVLRIQGVFDARRLGAFLVPLCVVPVVNIVLSIIAVDAVSANHWALVAVICIPAGAIVAHRSYTALAGRYANLESLYRFTQRVAGLSEEREVLEAVLGGLLEALSCEVAELVTLGGSGVVRYELRSGGELSVMETSDLPAVAGLLQQGEETLLAPRGKGPQSEALAADGLTDALVARLPSDSADQRLLIVADKHGAATFNKADMRFMEALAAQSAVALRGTRLLDELRSEVASREHEALHDNLTQLGNRALFALRSDAALLRRPADGIVAIMLLDLDGFKEINDTLGHHVGDVVLQEVARRLRVEVGNRGVPTRLGGDEFAIVLPSVAGMADVRRVAQEVWEAVNRPMEVGDLALSVQASVGIALSPDHGSDTASLLKGADVAMYSAKVSTESIVVYDSARDQHSTRRLLLASELRKAMEEGGLRLFYQPKVDMDTNRVLGFEALLRWTHHTFGEVSPTEFVPVAEQAGLIDTLTWWVLAEALRQQHEWVGVGFDLTMAVNISARSLLDKRLPDRLAEALEGSGVPPSRLILEVTETSVMTDTERAGTILDGAAALGVHIAVDDFGTGYSSLSRLLEMPVHEIKVDRSFVTTMLQSPDNLAIVSSTINLALSMGRRVTAEGVEDQRTWEVLRRLGCHAGQGYILARAMPADEALGWLEARRVTAPEPRDDHRARRAPVLQGAGGIDGLEARRA